DLELVGRLEAFHYPSRGISRGTDRGVTFLAVGNSEAPKAGEAILSCRVIRRCFREINIPRIVGPQVIRAGIEIGVGRGLDDAGRHVRYIFRPAVAVAIDESRWVELEE